jgi:hypothetical protein
MYVCVRVAVQQPSSTNGGPSEKSRRNPSQVTELGQRVQYEQALRRVQLSEQEAPCLGSGAATMSTLSDDTLRKVPIYIHEWIADYNNFFWYRSWYKYSRLRYSRSVR